jgi:formamidopyrimidine-DNA glycosylase
MPELPEVTTTVNGLQKVLPKLIIEDVWTDLTRKNPIKQFKDTIKDEEFFKKFKKIVIGVKIKKAERRAKNILIHLDNEYTILIHLKMTGHLLFGKYAYDKKKNSWSVASEEKNEALKDPYNRFIHVVFSMSNGKYLSFCDSRKFGKVTLIKTDYLEQSIHLKGVGPEPLEKSFTEKVFLERLSKNTNKAIKTVLMDQSIVAGIGNIYSDEMLWSSSIHLSLLYKSMKEVLEKGINFGGDSMSDYRNIDGERGNFQHHHNVYQKKNEVCGKKGCGGIIERKMVNGRSSHFCNKHQIIYN